MNHMYIIYESVYVDGGFGDPVHQPCPIGIVNTEQEAKEYCKKYSHLHVYDRPYADLTCGELYYEELPPMLDITRPPQNTFLAENPGYLHNILANSEIAAKYSGEPQPDLQTIYTIATHKAMSFLPNIDYKAVLAMPAQNPDNWTNNQFYVYNDILTAAATAYKQIHNYDYLTYSQREPIEKAVSDITIKDRMLYFPSNYDEIPPIPLADIIAEPTPEQQAQYEIYFPSNNPVVGDAPIDPDNR